MKTHYLYSSQIIKTPLKPLTEARDAFTQYLSKQPHSCRVWVMWAQMEKRAEARGNAGSSFRAREVLQKGLEINKDSACLISAWGLTELKRGNLYAAKAMLERAAEIDASVLPVLRWERVREAVVRLDTLRRHKKSQLL